MGHLLGARVDDKVLEKMKRDNITERDVKTVVTHGDVRPLTPRQPTLTKKRYNFGSYTVSVIYRHSNGEIIAVSTKPVK